MNTCVFEEMKIPVKFQELGTEIPHKSFWFRSIILVKPVIIDWLIVQQRWNKTISETFAKFKQMKDSPHQNVPF